MKLSALHARTIILLAFVRFATSIALPPVARRVPHMVRFGKVDGENRGANPMEPPIEINDDFFWLRDDARKSESVLGLLREENSYTESCTAHLEEKRCELYEEMLSHLQEDAEQQPSPSADGFEYWSRTVKGSAFRRFLRRPRGGATAEVILDVNVVAKTLPAAQEGQCGVSEVVPSPSGSLLAYTLDGTGFETYAIHLRKLPAVDDAGVDLADLGDHAGPNGADDSRDEGFEVLLQTAGGITWLDDQTLLYTSHDAAHRPFRVWRHRVGTSQAVDALVYEERDALFSVRCWRARDGSMAFVASESKESTEVRYIDSSTPHAAPTLVRARTHGVRYEVDSHSTSRSLMIISNADGAFNRQLHIASLDEPSVWGGLRLVSEHAAGSSSVAKSSNVLGHSLTRSLDGIFAFDEFVAVSGREDGLAQVWVVPLATDSRRETAGGAPSAAQQLCAAGPSSRLAFDSESSTAEVWSCDNQLFAPNGRLRVEFESMTTPRSLLEFDLRPWIAAVAPRSGGDNASGDVHAPDSSAALLDAASHATTLHVQPVADYDPSLYRTCRLEGEAGDGERVPLTLLWRGEASDRVADNASPIAQPPLDRAVHLYAYGSYGVCINPNFSAPRLSLVDRGVVFAIAHVRGGGEKGHHKWYEAAGKYTQKRNTFDDFLACANALIDRGIARRGALSIEGRSAGGLLVGATINMAPHLFCAALALVPFVDTMVTMCDPSIPLTIEEWEEWGNPNEARFHDYMMSYSPIHNVPLGATIPPLLIVSGLNDPHVAYWEPTKWAQVLRSRVANGEQVLLKMDLAAGHASASDRYRYLRETAFQYAWLLDQHQL